MVDMVFYIFWQSELCNWKYWYTDLSIFSQLLTYIFEYGKNIEKQLGGLMNAENLKRNVGFAYEKMAVYCNLILTVQQTCWDV